MPAAAPRELSMWTVYKRPRDYPRDFVARRSVITKIGKQEITDDVVVAPTLDEVRELIPPGLYRLDRMPGDLPHIVEVWL